MLTSHAELCLQVIARYDAETIN